MSATIFAVLPPVIAIALALITKEVYSSLLIGIFAGALMFLGFTRCMQQKPHFQSWEARLATILAF